MRRKSRGTLKVKVLSPQAQTYLEDLKRRLRQWSSQMIGNNSANHVKVIYGGCNMGLHMRMAPAVIHGWARAILSRHGPVSLYTPPTGPEYVWETIPCVVTMSTCYTIKKAEPDPVSFLNPLANHKNWKYPTSPAHWPQRVVLFRLADFLNTSYISSGHLQTNQLLNRHKI
ncbi:hypothetical protein H4Q26_016766 [Puccinia striiformis f. sp. tritici PST-130]|nr:hypothetical protein H4Q26_016766 [Puccinia striiformis f. sp. tritici PST-130]